MTAADSLALSVPEIVVGLRLAWVRRECGSPNWEIWLVSLTCARSGDEKRATPTENDIGEKNNKLTLIEE